MCDACEKRKVRCSICNLPITNNYLKTKDGRYICPFEKNRVILNQKAGIQLFNQVVKSVNQITQNRMRLRSRTLNIQLFDVDYWNSGRVENMKRKGFSQSRGSGGGMSHSVGLLLSSTRYPSGN